MKHLLSMLLMSVLLVNTVSSASLAMEQTTDTITNPLTIDEETSYVENEVLVTLKNPKDDELTTEGSTDLDSDITVEQSWDFNNNEVISQVSSDELSTEELMKKLSQEDDVVAVEPNYIRQKFAVNDPYSTHQWYLDGNSSFAGTSQGIHYSKAPASSNTSPIVAVVDTGIDYTHEDLKDHMWKNPYASLAGTYGYDFGDDDSDPMDEDEDGHGTHCAGVIAASTNNNTGIAGISNTKLMALKIFDSSGSAKDSAIIDAFYYIYNAQQLGANITTINCSWGGGGKTSSVIQYLIDVIGKKGGLFVFAAGNSNKNHDTSEKTCPYDISSNYIVKVGASNANDQKASFSDYGKTTVDLFAPGDNILSTVNKEIFSPALYSEAQRKQLCLYYSAYNSNDTTLYSATDIEQFSYGMTYIGTGFSSVDYQNKSGSGSLCATIYSRVRSANLVYYMDVTNLTMEDGKQYYVSYDLGSFNNNSISWEHSSLTRTTKDIVTYNGRNYLPLVQLAGDFRSTSCIYIDNPSISVATNSATRFGKYNVLSGTSMAAPCVSGAVALLSQRYPGDTTAQRRTRLLTCVRQTTGVSTYCSSGGILDLSKLTTASYANTSSSTTTTKKKVKVKKIKLNKKKATLYYKKKLKLKATVTPKNATNKKVKWSVSRKKYATVTQKGVVKAKKKGIGHTIKVYAKAKDGSEKKAYCKIKIKKRKK